MINNKIYIGKHQTEDINDGYMGSGKHLKYSISKYGIENFKKEILFVFDNENDMNYKEKELVTEEFCLREDTYNICPGGDGGFGYINQTGQNFKGFSSQADRNRYISPFIKGHQYGILGNKKRNELNPTLSSESAKRRNKTGEFGFKGRVHSSISIDLMTGPRENSRGSNNSQFGTIWITNGNENKKISKYDEIPNGFKKGRNLIIKKGIK